MALPLHTLRPGILLEHQKLVLLVIFVIALLPRLGLVVVLGEEFLLTADPQYDAIASRIVAGEGYFVGEDHLEGLGKRFTGKDKMYSHRAPLYPYTLVVLYTLFGVSPLVAGVFQALLGSVTAILFFFIGRRFFNERIGLAVAFVAALYPYSIIHDVRIIDTALFEFLLALVVLSMLRLRERPSFTNSVLTGFVVGLAIHCRPSFVLFIPFLFVPYLFAYRFGVARVLRVAIPIVLTIGIVLSPWLVRNYLIHDRLLLSTYGGWAFIIGNSEVTLQAVRERGEVDGLMADHLRRSSITLEHLTEAEIDRWFYTTGFEFIRNNPATSLQLLWIKAINLWNVRLSPPSSSPWREIIYTVSYGTILVLSMPGLVLSVRNWRQFIVLYLLFVFFTVAYVPFLTFTRYRKPLDPYLAMFACYALLCLYEKFRLRKGDGRTGSAFPAVSQTQ